MGTTGTSWKKAFRGFNNHVCLEDVLADAELSRIDSAKADAKAVLDGGKRECCRCAECKIGKKRYPLHRSKDCQYATARSSKANRSPSSGHVLHIIQALHDSLCMDKNRGFWG